MTDARIEAIRNDFLATDHIGCIGCGSHEIAGTIVIEPEDDDCRADLGLPPNQVVCVGLCGDCWDMDRDDLLDLVSLRMVPVHQRN